MSIVVNIKCTYIIKIIDFIGTFIKIYVFKTL